MTQTKSKSPIVTAILSEPITYFCLIALGIFAAYAIGNNNEREVLEIDQRELDALFFLSENTSDIPLSDTNKSELTRNYINEQILVREALTLGLDNDSRIHSILAQKARHVLSAEVIQPTQQELELFYDNNKSLYENSATVSVDELVFDSRDPLATETREGLFNGLSSVALLALEAGSAAPLLRVSHLDLSNIFSVEFADQVFANSPGQWSGPFLSNRGQHWLQITESNPASTPSLEEISDLVRLDWMAAEEDIRLDEKIEDLRSQYEIVFINASDK